ncbi:MAG: hypothetical protein DMG07_20535 [Acidobacteria bacterium]|nr:MAG: hypothetical protein DMG07_20535 [Acidobacteriota bacterium]
MGPGAVRSQTIRRLILVCSLIALSVAHLTRAGSDAETSIPRGLDDLYAVFKDEIRAGVAGAHYRGLGNRWQLDGIVYNHVFQALNAYDLLRKVESTSFSGRTELLRRQTTTVAQGFERVLDSIPWPKFRVDLESDRIVLAAPQELTVAHGVRQPVLFFLRNATNASRAMTLSSTELAFEPDRVDVASGQTRYLVGTLEAQKPGGARIGLRIAAGGGLVHDGSVRVAVQETGWLVATVTEGDARAIARVRVTDSSGRYWPPEEHNDGLILKMHGPEHDQIAQRWFYADGSFRVRVPAGRIRVAIRRGLEYSGIDEDVEIEPGRSVQKELKLTRWADMRARGWYSGDLHIHYLDPATALFESKAEDIHVASVLVFNNIGSISAREHFTGALDRISDSEHLVYYDEEFRNNDLGHIGLLKLKRLVDPISTGYLGTTREWLFRADVFNNFEVQPSPNTADAGSPDRLLLDATRATHRQGGLVNWAHLRDELEFPLDAALGELDAVDILTNTRLENALPSWYHLLNCGLRLPATAGTDRGGPALPIGHQRTYVRLKDRFTYDGWIEGIRQGRSFVTNNPMLTLTVNGLDPGGEVRMAEPGEVEIRAEAVSRLPFQRLELVINGDVVRAENADATGRRARMHLRVPLQESAWIAARVSGEKHPELIYYPHPRWSKPVFAHTSPIYVRYRDQKIEKAESARYLLDRIAKLESWALDDAYFANDERKSEALRTIRRGKEFYQTIAQLPSGAR